MVNCYSFDIDGTMVWGGGLVPTSIVKSLKENGHIILGGSDHPEVTQWNEFKMNGIELDEVPMKARLGLMKEKYPNCEHYYHIGDTEDDKQAALVAGFEYLAPNEFLSLESIRNMKGCDMEKLRVGILGATGAIGQQFVKFLIEHPLFEIKLLTASKKSAGKRYYEATTWLADFTPEGMPKKARNMIVEDTTIENIERARLDLVFCALPAEIALTLLPKLAKRGIMCIDKSSAFREGLPKGV